MIKGPLRLTGLFALLSLAAGACLADTADLFANSRSRAGCTVGTSATPARNFGRKRAGPG
jgi:hypothetical protein